MVKKSFLLVILFAFVCLTSGCLTIYNDGACANQCPKKSAKVATEEGPNVLKKADDWVKTNLW